MCNREQSLSRVASQSALRCQLNSPFSPHVTPLHTCLLTYGSNASLMGPIADAKCGIAATVLNIIRLTKFK